MDTILSQERRDADSRMVRKAFLGAGLACALVIGAGTLAFWQELQLSDTSRRTVYSVLAASQWASRAAVAALECRRYEKDVFLNLNDAATRRQYLRKWDAACSALRRDLELLQSVNLPDADRRSAAECLAAVTTYQRHVQDIADQIAAGRITRPEDANRAITPFKDDFRRVARDTAALAEEQLARAGGSGVGLRRSLLLNSVMTWVLVILPIGLILAWTVWLTRDIAAHHVKLRQREKRLESIICHASEIIYTLSPEGIVTFTSSAWSDKLGWEISAVQGKSFAPFVHPDDLDRCLSALRTVLTTGEPQRGVEYRIQHKDGGWRWHKSSASLVRDEAGQPPRLVGIAEDITEFKAADEARTRSVSRLAGLNRLQEELILAAPLEEKFQKLTEAAVGLLGLDFCRIWSVEPGDLCDAGCIHATATDEAHLCRRRDKCLHLLASSGRYSHTDGDHRRVPLGCYKIGRVAAGAEKKFLTNDVIHDPRIHNHQWAKQLGLVSFAGYKLHDARGNTTGVLGLFAKHPITDEDDAFLSHLAETTSEVIVGHRIEEDLRQAQKLEGVGQLAGGVAHEFNNLLQVIDGYSRAAMEGLDPEEERYAHLQQICQAAERAAALTRQLLGFSRRRAIQRKNTDTNVLIRDLVKLIRPMIGEHISLELTLDDDVGTVFADAGELQQALLNLCVNARDSMQAAATSRARGVLMLKTEKALVTEPFWDSHFDLAPGSYVVISVSDTGCGIPRDIQSRIFEPFFTTKEVGKGTGLGLALVYGVVRQHKGAIHLYSELGHGTTFKLYLPSGNQAPDAEALEQPAATLPGQETILVAEDEPTVRTLTVRTLEKAGYTVLAAADGEEALRMFQRHHDTIDLVVLDAVMPKLTGYEVYRRIRQDFPATKVLCCTGYDRETVRSDCLARENVPLIAKPFTSRSLLSTVRETLDAGTPCPLAGETVC